MPYQWLPSSDAETRLHLWPYRSLPHRGFVWFVGITAAMFALPAIALFGTPVLWGMLPFLLAAIAAIWWALQRSYRDGEIIESLTLRADKVRLVREGPRGLQQEWEANPHWVRVVNHPSEGPVENYLTLQGGPREVEIGAFLTPTERLALLEELSQALKTISP